MLVVAALIAGAQASVFNIFHGTTLQTLVPPALVSRVASVHLLGASAAVPLGLSLTGPTAQATSAEAVLCGAGCFAIVGTLAVLLVPDVRRLAADQPHRGNQQASTTVAIK